MTESASGNARGRLLTARDRVRYGARRRAGSPHPAGFLPRIGLLLLAVLATGCSEGESPLFNPGSQRDGLLAMPETLFVAEPVMDRPIRAELSSGFAPVLRIARSDTLEAIAYLQFGDFPDTSTVTSARLGLRMHGGQGDAIRVSAHEVISDTSWSETALLWEKRPAFADEPFFTYPQPVPVREDSFLVERVVEIPGATIRRWVRDPDSNRGIALLLSEGSSDGVLEVLSRKAVLTDQTGVRIANPPLEVMSGDSILKIVSPVKDAFVYLDRRDPLPPDGELVRISEWLPTRALLKFDFPDSLLTLPDSVRLETGEDPRGITVNRALLRLYLDSPEVPEGISAGVYHVDGEWDESGDDGSLEITVGAFYDRAVVAAELDSIGWSLSLDIGDLVQRWFDGGANHGLLVRAIGEVSSRRSIAIHSGSSEEAKRPQLRLLYTMPPDPRWAKGGAE